MLYYILNLYNMKKIINSKLQENILKNIILTEQPNFTTISTELKKNRLTISQSIASLLKKQCITKEPINPLKEKSKLYQLAYIF